MKEYKLRSLKTKDIFALSRVIKAMDLKFDFEEDMDTSKIGIEIMTKVIANIGGAETEVTAFIAELAGLTPDEFAELDIDVAFDLIKQFKEMKGLSGFFTSATKLTNQ